MKIAVLSDTHLCKRQYRTEEGFMNRFEKAIYDVFFEALHDIKKQNTDLLIWCGDIFDTANPSVISLNQFKQGLKIVEDIPSLMILGNHDFSFNNRGLDYSAVSLTEYKQTKLVEYDVDYYIQDDTLFVLAPYVYDTDDNIQEIWKQCHELVQKHSVRRKILVTHGVTEQFADKNPALSDKFMVPTDLVQEFDLVLIGHIHTPFDYKDGDTLVISPGALVDYQAYENRTGPLYLDTETLEFRREILDTPHIVKKKLNEKNCNEILREVGPYIYNFTYDGDPSKIDQKLFDTAKKKAINITIELTKNKKEEVKPSLETNFYKWIKETYPDRLEVFLNAKNELGDVS